MGSNTLIWVHFEKELLCCDRLGSLELGRVGSAFKVLAWLGSAVLRFGLLTWANLGSPLILCLACLSQVSVG